MLDVDHFKNINDTYGHQVGDIVLIQLASIIQKSVRSTDFPGRWGGEEFLIICIETGLDGVKILAEKLKEKLEKHSFPEVKQSNVTASFGITEYYKDESINEMLIRVDEAMYKAKKNGRNQVIAL